MGTASAFFGLIVFLWVIFRTSESLSGPHIADLNVLLPPLMTNPVEYRLVGSDGCFTWSWDHHDILSVEPEYNDSSHCSSSARLVSIAPYSGQKETAVYAKDLLSGIVIRCEVFIHKISRIKIFHHSVKLDLDGISTLRAIGFDDEENVFSSLVGVRFMWQLRPISFEDDKPSPHLTHVPLKDTPLSDCGGFCGDREIQKKLESSGVASDLLVVKGVEIGQDNVSVRMIEPEFEHIADTILLTVAEAMALDPPSPVFVIVGALVHYHLKVLRNNIPQAVTLPSPYHHWSVDNASVALVDPAMGLASAMNLGVTNIVVEDLRVSGHRQLSSLRVVLPDRLVLYIQPVSISCYPLEGAEPIPSIIRWYLVVGQEYVVYLKVFSIESGIRPIYITENESVDVAFNPSTHWDIFSVPDDISLRHGWQNCTRIKAISKGLGSLSASLTFQDVNSEPKVVNVEQEVMICDHVNIISQEAFRSRIVRLPWVPDVYQDFQLKASGGCVLASEDYEWFSSDIGVVSVSTAGIVTSKGPGLAVIKVISVFDPLNYDEVVIEVSIPSSISMIQSFPVEAEVESYIMAAVTLKTENGSYYDQCDAFRSSTRWQLFGDGEPFRIAERTGDVHAIGIFNPEHSENGPPCAWIQLYASSAGRAALHADVVKDLDFGKNIFGTSVHLSLKAAKTLAAYTPLVACLAGDGNKFGGYKVDVPINLAVGQNIFHACLSELYLVPGTRMSLLLYGGPEHWDKDVEFKESVDIVGRGLDHPKNGVNVANSFVSGETLYDVFCQTVGTYELIFSRGNLIGNDHPVPAIAVAEVLLTCALPSSVVVIANEPANTPSVIKSAVHALRSPENVQVMPITVANSCSIRVAGIGVHSSGKAFANSSSLNLNWELERCDCAEWNMVKSSENFGSSWEKDLLLHNASGLCLVRATVIGFSYSMSGALKEASLLLERSENVLTDAVQLQLVSTLRIDPEFLLLYYHPNSKEMMLIFGGTSSVRYAVNDTAVIEAVQQSKEGEVVHLMLSARGIGGALVTVEDVGVNPPIAASAMVLVADIEWIKILLPEKIRLMVRTTKSIDIMAGIYDGSTFSSSQYTYMNVHVHFEEDLLELLTEDELSRSATGGISQPSFSVRATKLGVTMFHVSARQASGHEVMSQTIEVEVYAPLVVHPNDVYLAPGASYVLAVTGGPTKGTVIEFSSTNTSSATVDITSGRLSAISSGNTIIHVRACDSVGTLICEASAEVKVGIPTSISIYLQTNQLGIGCKLPVFPISPQHGNLFSFYEVCKNYKWTIENEQVLSFQKAKEFLPSSEGQMKMIDDLSEDPLEFIHVLHGRSAGKSNVAVSFSCEFASSGSTSHHFFYNASEEITVVPNPPLSLGIPATWVLPPFYTTKSILPVSSGDLSHHGQGRKITYLVMRVCQKGVWEPFNIIGTRLQTFNSTAIGCIQAFDRTTGRTEIASCVKVAEVAQVRIDVEKSPSRVIYLDVGASKSLVVSYHDSLGYSFLEAAGVVSLSVSTNHPDIISIIAPDTENDVPLLNGTVQIKGIHPGKALLRLSMTSNWPKEDYILVLVRSNLRPHKPIFHVGDRINFSVSGEGMLGTKAGWWSSANSSIVSVEKDSGKAIALGEGTTQVFFKSTSLDQQTTVTVLRDSVILHAPSEALTNVHFPSDGYKFLIQLSHYHANMIEEFSEAVDLPCDCGVDPPFIGHVKAWKDVNAGKYYCIFFPHSPEQLSHALPVLGVKKVKNDDSGSMFISVSAKLRGADHVAGSVHVPFCGGYSILGVQKLNLSPNSTKNRITVLGNTGVQVSWYAHDRLEVNRLVIEDSVIGGKVEYEVKALQDTSFRDKLIFMLPGIGQASEVDISYEAGESIKGSSAEKPTNLLLTFVFCFCVLVATVVIFLRCFIKPERLLAQPHLISATPSDPRTPLRMQDMPKTDAFTPSRSSPRTPQPYTEYLRRTIDETPYARRHGRVVDPSYSY